MTSGVALALALCLGACQPQNSEAPPTSPPSPSPPPTAAADDLCTEHGLLESLCTRCNPALAVVFKNKGDWCVEHDVPESLCPTCHPERQGRPAPEVAKALADQAPVNGTVIRFAHANVQDQAGLTIARAEPVLTTHGLTVPATLAYDGTRVAEINARLAALVETVHVEVGARVEAGAPLATLRSTTLEGERARLQAARERVRILTAQRDRKRNLQRTQLVSESEVLDAEEALVSARAELKSAEATLSLVVADAAGRFTVTSPLAGLIVERHVNAGMLVTAEEPLFVVVDPSSMWAELDVPERDVGSLAVGMAATVRATALPDRLFQGETAYIAPSVDKASRTVSVRVPLANPDLTLRAHMFATVTIETRAPTPSVRIPAAAVQRVAEVDLVFVQTSATTFETRRVTVAQRQGDHVVLSAGLAPDEPVVVAGSFLLKTEILKDSIGAGCCETD